MDLPESHPLIRAKRRAGRMKRYVKRQWWERNIGKQYKAWLLDSQQRLVGSIDNAVPLAVMVPVYNPPVRFLEECLSSVLNQTGRNWQLIVSDDGSTEDDVVCFLDRFTVEHADDARVVVIRGENDDRLNPRAVELMSEAIATGDPRPQVIYSDEDKFDTKGEHYELYCKPDFSPELLLTQMYLCHFTVFDTDLVRIHGGFRSEMNGAQDFDLTLRLLPELHHVVHIPLPLYHWRAWSESTALTIDAKPWAQQAGQRAQQSHLERSGGGTVVPSKVPGLNEVHPAVHGHPRVSVVIPTIGARNTQHTARFVDDAVHSLREAEPSLELEIIAVTTGTIDPIYDVDKQVVYQPQEGFNFAEAVNIGRSQATGYYLLILNDDTTADFPSPVTRMLEMGQRPGVGAVGAKLSYPDSRLQHAGIVLLPSGPTHVHIAKTANFPGYFGSTLTPRNYLAVTAAAMLTPIDAFDEIGGFDSQFARDFNDVDYCLRLREAGYRIAWTPYAHLTHHEGASIVRKTADPAELAEFQRRWSTKIQVDPFYSPALNQSLDRIYEAL